VSTAEGQPGLKDFLAEIFRCPPEVAQAIVQRAADRRFPAGRLIVRQGEDHDQTYLLVDGRTRAVAYARDGQIVLLQEYLPGDMFGAFGQPDARRSEIDVIAASPARTAVFLAFDLLHLFETHACVGLAVSRMLLRQLRAATERMVERTTLSSVGRVYAELLRLAELADGRTIQPAPAHTDLALRVQTTRETASRAVNGLERRGIVRRADGALHILSRRRLEELIA
jgi:CRP/FNR family transcriptional regulator, cyclic AMP receptor protein